MKHFILAALLAAAPVAASAATLTLNGTIRDFEGGATGARISRSTIDGLRTGMIRSTLDVEGEPVLIGGPGGSFTTAENFAQWFRDVPGVNQSEALAADLSTKPARAGFVQLWQQLISDR